MREMNEKYAHVIFYVMVILSLLCLQDYETLTMRIMSEVKILKLTEIFNEF